MYNKFKYMHTDSNMHTDCTQARKGGYINHTSCYLGLPADLNKHCNELYAYKYNIFKYALRVFFDRVSVVQTNSNMKKSKYAYSNISRSMLGEVCISTAWDNVMGVMCSVSGVDSNQMQTSLGKHLQTYQMPKIKHLQTTVGKAKHLQTNQMPKLPLNTCKQLRPTHTNYLSTPANSCQLPMPTLYLLAN